MSAFALVVAVIAAAGPTPVKVRAAAADVQLPERAPSVVLPLSERDIDAVRDFDRRVAEYVSLHRLLEGPVPAPYVSSDIRVVGMAIDALAQRIQTARRDARQGDLFTPEVTRVFRKRIAACLTPEEWEQILHEHGEEGHPADLPSLRVNARWPALMPFNFVPPQLIAALPALPPELQYRIIGRSIVLWDHHADLIVDFIPGAITS